MGGRRNELAQASLDFCVPPVHVSHQLVDCIADGGEHDHLLVLDVAPTAGVVHANSKDEVYLRVGDENRKLTFAQRQELAFDRGHDSYEARPLPGATVDTLDTTPLSECAGALGAPDPLRLLRARGLLTGDTPTVAGLLLFDQHPRSRPLTGSDASHKVPREAVAGADGNERDPSRLPPASRGRLSTWAAPLRWAYSRLHHRLTRRIRAPVRLRRTRRG